MALKPIVVSNPNSRTHISIDPAIISIRSFQCTATSATTLNKNTDNTNSISRRLGLGLIALVASSVAVMPAEVAKGLDIKLIAPDQTFEEAERGIRGHAEALLQVKDFIESESWKEAQKTVRSSSPLLKRDIHTIIQYKPAAERPTLRKLYSLLFNNATGLDYAARDKDAERVWKCYDNMVMALSDILSRI